MRPAGTRLESETEIQVDGDGWIPGRPGSLVAIVRRDSTESARLPTTNQRKSMSKNMARLAVS